jgi:septum formation protein
VQIVLASRSPQRREILQRLGLKFEVVVPEVEEVRGGEPAEDVLENARRKAEDIGPEPGTLVIGCDTDVVVDGRTLGKPANQDQAREFLELLSGRSHEVLSGLAVLGPDDGRERTGAVGSTVTFRQLDEAEIDRYLRSGEWRDRAGAYAIQGLGATLVERVEGDVSNVIGLPVALLLDLAPELAP